MRSWLVFAAFAALTATSVNAQNLRIGIFDTDLVLPDDCSLYARPAILDRHVRIQCDGAKPGSNIHIYVQEASACIAELSRKGIEITYKKELADRTLASTKTTQMAVKEPTLKVMHKRLAWDKEVCLLVLGGNEQALDKFVAPIWR